MNREQRPRMETRSHAAVVRRHLVLVLAVMAVVMLSALALTQLQEHSYTSTGRLLVARGESVFRTTPTAADPDFVQTEIEFLKSVGVRDIVRTNFGSAPKVEAIQVGTTSVVELRAEGSTARGAKDAVDAYMDAYLNFRRQAAAEEMAGTAQQVEAAVDNLQKQIDALSAQLRAVNCPPTGGCPERTAVEQDREARVQEQVPFRQKLSQLSIDSASTYVGGVVIPASLPSAPTSPNPVRNGLIAVVLGAFLGVGLAILFESVDESVRDSDDVERSAPDVPVLAVIPRDPGGKAKSDAHVVTMTDPTSPSAEAYRTLRTSVRFLAVDRPVRSLQVTSATNSEGKTTTTANLALVLARAGELVIMVNCDFRRPRLHEHFGLSNDVGLTSVLLGEATLAEALQPVTEARGLWLLSAGPRPPNPSDLLSSARTSEVLNRLQSQGTILVIDSPPVLTLSDAAILSGKVDGTLLTVRAGVSRRTKVARAVDFLHQIGAPLVGTVFHDSSSQHSDEDGYWDTGSQLAPVRKEPGFRADEGPLEGVRQPTVADGA